MSPQQQRVSSQVQSSQAPSNGQLKADVPDPEVVSLRQRLLRCTEKRAGPPFDTQLGGGKRAG